MFHASAPPRLTEKKFAVAALTIASAATLLIGAASVPATARTEPLSAQARALERGLSDLDTHVRRANSTVAGAHGDVRSTRKNVDRTRSMVRNIGKMEGRLRKLIGVMGPLRSVPNVGIAVGATVKTLKKMLPSLRKLRKKMTRLDKDALHPARRKLREFEAVLVATQRKLGRVLGTSRRAQSALSSTRRAGLLAGARNIGRSASRTRRSAQQANSNVGNVRRSMQQMRSALSELDKAGRTISAMDRQLRPIERFADKLNRTLNKRRTIRLVVKKVTFTYRQVLEAPGNAKDKVMGKLKKIVAKALRPITKRFPKPKVRIPVPPQIDQVVSRLKNVTRAMQHTSSQLTVDLSKRADVFNRTVGQYVT
jgi:hypothetical protein